MKQKMEEIKMELEIIKTINDTNIEASLYIEKGLLSHSWDSNYISKNMFIGISQYDVIDDIEYGIDLLNTSNNKLFHEDIHITFEENKKIVLDSASVDNIKPLFQNLVEENFKDGIYLKKVSMIIMDDLL